MFVLSWNITSSLNDFRLHINALKHLANSFTAHHLTFFNNLSYLIFYLKNCISTCSGWRREQILFTMSPAAENTLWWHKRQLMPILPVRGICGYWFSTSSWDRCGWVGTCPASTDLLLLCLRCLRYSPHQTKLRLQMQIANHFLALVSSDLCLS